MARYLNRKFYENICFEDPDGNKMFYCDQKKAQWYLDRNLATIISDEPMVLRLKFKPKGRGYYGDAYYLDKKIDQCVVCGSKKKLTRHHVVPKMYRRHLQKIKCRNYHDILLLCVKHHDIYELLANELKEKIAIKYGCPLLGDGWHFDLDLLNVKKSAAALLRKGIPCWRREELISIIQNYYKKNITADDIKKAAEIDPIIKSASYREHGNYVVSQLSNDEIKQFVYMWRTHFVESMNPKFLPRYWSIRKQVLV